MRLNRREMLKEVAVRAGVLSLAHRALGCATTCPARSASSAEPPTFVSADFDNANVCRLTDSCVEGPVFVCDDLFRRDIRDGRPGSPLRAGFRVLDRRCRPIADAVVDVWHTDGRGAYSAYPHLDPDEAAFVPFHLEPRGSDRFCRGRQSTNHEGIAELHTIFPGWYAGRATHIHLRVSVADDVLLTSQLFFPEDVKREIYRAPPYNWSRNARYVENGKDLGGLCFSDDMLLTVNRRADAWIATINLVLDRAYE